MAAYWISPKNEIVNVPTNHIDVVISNPETFGMTKDEIEVVYTKHGEPVGMEGEAREEIIRDLVKKNWIRVRQYRNQGWSVNINRLSKKVKDNIFDLFNRLTTTGVLGYKEKDPYASVNILSFDDDQMKKVTIKDVLGSVLYEGLEIFESSNGLVMMVLKENKMKNWLDLLRE